jgi:hypothetical protein
MVFIIVFVEAMLGQWPGAHLRENHRSSETHDAVQVTTAMISVLAALVLGLLTASVTSALIRPIHKSRIDRRVNQ